MSSSSKRLKFVSPEPATFIITDAKRNVDVTAPLPSTSAPSKDDDTGSCVFTDGVNKTLPVILANSQILTTKDLLHFRLVNRCWRDAATSVLLKQSACDIVLKIGEVAHGGDVNPTSHEQLLEVNPDYDRDDRRSPTFKYYNARPPHSLLPDLIQTISKSREFPSNSIKFLPGCEKALKNLPLSLPNEIYQLEDDELMRLFALFGKNIKKLIISTRISSHSVERLLFLHTPNLVSLDFSRCYKFETRDRDQQQNQVFHLRKLRSRSFNRNLNLRILSGISPGVESNLHWSKAEFLKQLVSISPHLRAVQDAGVGALSMLVILKKAHLIKSLFYNPASSHQFECAKLKEALELYPMNIPPIKLGKLTGKLSRLAGYYGAYRDVASILGILLRRSKDTLEYLELHVNPKDFLVNIKIPPLRKLKCLKLVREKESFENPLWSKKQGKRDPEDNLPLDRCVYDRHVFQFQDQQNPSRIPPDYFPVLSKVFLDVDSGSLNTANKLLAFFALEHTGKNEQSTVRGDVIKSVSTLELSAFPKVDNKLGTLFPNLRNLKITCEPLTGTTLHNWVWGAFPKLERFEIHDFIPGAHKKVVDSFFTGIPQELSTKLAASSDAKQNLLNRTLPYIGDCENLKEFTIQFKEKILATFATELSSLYAFQGIAHKTKIVFSFESVNLSEQDREEVGKHLEPISPYIELRR